MAAVVNKELCTACGICAEQCPNQAITINDVAHVDSEKCTECGICVDECPNDAISLPE
jgi:ferredoxin